MRTTPHPIVIDCETERIQSRPAYPPIPVGFSIKWPREKRSQYYAWGHPTGNNCDKKNAIRVLKKAWMSGEPLLFHSGKFDYDVITTHLDCPPLPWDRIEDTLYLVFLYNPHAASLGLKPAAAELLGMPPEERDIVKEWIEENIAIEKGLRWGAYICKAPGDIVGRYANGDVIRTEKLFYYLWPIIQERGMGAAYDRERRLMPVFLENERNGLRVDVRALERDIPVYQKAKDSADAWLRKRLKAPDMNIDSDAEVAAALDRQGIVEEWTLTKTGKKSVSKKNLFLGQFSDKRVFYMLGYRNRLTTCLSMFMEKWLDQAHQSGGRILPNWNQVRQMKADGRDTKGTRTGRPSCDEPNLLNLSKSFEDRGDDYTHPKFFNKLELPLVRKYVLPDKNEQWGHRDFNQQELRILAHYEDDAILKAYNDNPDLDIHSFVQAEIKRIMHRALDRVSVKTMNFGKLYGQGLGSLAQKLHVSRQEVIGIRDSQNRALPGLKTLEDDIKAWAKAGKPIITWGGRMYYCEPPKYSEKFGREMTFEYKLINYLVQGSAADATKEAIIRYAGHPRKCGRFLVTVYDEINFSAPPRLMAAEQAVLRECMEGLEFDVPMPSDAKVGPNWGTLTKYKEK